MKTLGDRNTNYSSNSTQGASPRELVVEACRRDQPHLIHQVLDEMEDKTNEEVAEFFNNVKDALGNHAAHICATYGSCTYFHIFPPCLQFPVL